MTPMIDQITPQSSYAGSERRLRTLKRRHVERLNLFGLMQVTHLVLLETLDLSRSAVMKDYARTTNFTTHHDHVFNLLEGRRSRCARSENDPVVKKKQYPSTKRRLKQNVYHGKMTYLPLQGVLVCDHAGRVISKLSHLACTSPHFGTSPPRCTLHHALQHGSHGVVRSNFGKPPHRERRERHKHRVEDLVYVSAKLPSPLRTNRRPHPADAIPSCQSSVFPIRQLEYAR